MKKSLEKSTNILEEKRKIVKRKICMKKDTHVYNNCYEQRSRAIKKLYQERTMNGLGKPLQKKSDPKNRKHCKNQSEIAACEQKTTSEKANFCSTTVLSLYFKFRAKKLHAAKPLAFSLHFVFRRDQNHYSNLNSKIMKMCEQILKKRQRPNTIQIL